MKPINRTRIPSHVLKKSENSCGRKTFLRLIALSLCLSLLVLSALSLSGCAMRTSVSTKDLMQDITPASVAGRSACEAFIKSNADFSVKLFQKTVAGNGKENTVISPLSAMLVLAMTANGADGETKEQMEKLLGGDISLEQLNEYLHACLNGLSSSEKSKLSIANSIWFRDADRLSVEKNFLQTNADYYGAQIYKAPFNKTTLNDINLWVKENTDGMIDGILEEISDSAVMYLLSAMALDAEWEEIYKKEDVKDGFFDTDDGFRRKAEMMHSNESKFFCDDTVDAFMKLYKGGKYGFVAFLPNEDVSIDEYIGTLDGGKYAEIVGNLINGITNAEYSGSVSVYMPKFGYDCSFDLSQTLVDLGMKNAFDGVKADFSKLGRSSAGNIFISKVKQKTFIAVDERGTRAGAVTLAEMMDGGPMIFKTINLDRPFVYAIVDTESGLPLFMGAVKDISK